MKTSDEDLLHADAVAGIPERMEQQISETEVCIHIIIIHTCTCTCMHLFICGLYVHVHVHVYSTFFLLCIVVFYASDCSCMQGCNSLLHVYTYMYMLHVGISLVYFNDFAGCLFFYEL